MASIEKICSSKLNTNYPFLGIEITHHVPQAEFIIRAFIAYLIQIIYFTFLKPLFYFSYQFLQNTFTSHSNSINTIRFSIPSAKPIISPSKHTKDAQTQT